MSENTLFHVGRPNIGDTENFIHLVRDILGSKWLTNNGKYVQEFERKLASYFGVRNVIATCNATIGMQALLDCALPRKGKVILPDFTFIATAHSVHLSGNQPVIADVDRTNHCLSPSAVRKLIDQDTVAIVGVHLWGNACFVEEFEAISKEFNIPVFYDAAHAFGSKYKEKYIGAFGDAEVFSFHATKIFNTFEGGAITTNNDELAERLRKYINFGFTGVDSISGWGTNGKMSEICAAMGVINLDCVSQHIYESKEVFRKFALLTEDFDGLDILKPADQVTSNYHYVVFSVDPIKLNKSRDQIVEMLWANGVLARRYFLPGVSRSTPYLTAQKGDLSVSQELCQYVIVLPGGPSVGLDECVWMIDLIRSFCR